MSRASFVSNTATGPPMLAASPRIWGSSTLAPCAAHAFMHSVSSHSPMTLRRKRVRPSTPPSFVKPASRAAPVSTGDSISTPTRPQVPQETNTAPRSEMGVPTIADAYKYAAYDGLQAIQRETAERGHTDDALR